jgi:acetolactate synthase-1/2/3 large subunit
MREVSATTSAPREVAELMLATMALSGVSRLWFTSGSDLVAFQEAAAKAKATGAPAPAITPTVHEHVALSAAMGESMVTGRPVVVAAHADLGLQSFGGAIHNAARGGYPVLVMTGYPPTSASARTSPVFWLQQRPDQGAIVRQYVKWDYRLGVHEDASLVTARALQVALAPPTGPTYLAVPAEVSSSPAPAPAVPVVASDLGIPRLGAGPDDQIREIARRLVRAERPLVITDRVGRHPEAVALLAQIADDFAVGVRASRHRMNLSDDHPARVGAPSVSEADAILVLEHAVPWLPATEEPAEGAFVAVAGEDPAQISIPVYEFRAHERVVASPAPFLAALLEQMRCLRTSTDLERHRERRAAFERLAGVAAGHRAAAAAAACRSRVPSPLALGSALSAILEPDDIFTWELADSSAVRRTRPGSLFDKGGSSLGWAVAAACGARLADPARPAVCLTGDGSYLFGVPTALLYAQYQHQAPVLTVVCNNRGYRTGTSSLAEHYPEGFAVRAGDLTGGTFDPPPDIAAEARAAGAFGEKVLDTAQLPGTLAAARRATEVEGRPAVVDVWLPALVTGAHPLGERGEAERG